MATSLYPPLGPKPDPFPRDANGALINPDYIKTEGERINQALAHGQYGNQPVDAALVARGVPQVTVVPTQTASEQFRPVFWEQQDWQKTPEQLRQDLRLEDLQTRAEQRRLQLENQPTQQELANRLTQARIDAAGAHDRFIARQDQETLVHTAGFLNELANGPGPHEAGFDAHALGALDKFPRFAETKGGQALLTRLGKTSDTQASIAKLREQIPQGYDVKDIHLGPKGPSITLRSPGEARAAQLKEFDLKPTDIDANANIAVVSRDPTTNKWQGNNAGTHVAVTNKEGKRVYLPIEEYQRLGGKFSQDTIDARAGAAKMDLARKALQPNSGASPEEQARAREILQGR